MIRSMERFADTGFLILTIKTLSTYKVHKEYIRIINWRYKNESIW
jgi:hypothetical protein